MGIYSRRRRKFGYIMANLSLLEVGDKLNVSDNGSSFIQNASVLLESPDRHLGPILLKTLTILLSILGLAGNGVTIWLLGFHIEKNHFTTYIINLAIADFGVLSTLFTYSVSWILLKFIYFNIFYYFKMLSLVFFCFVYNASLSFLAAISIDRCVSIFFPLWYRCHRPTYLSCVTCAIIWIVSNLFVVIHFILSLSGLPNDLLSYQCLLNIVILTPLISLSTIILVIKVCLIFTKLKQGRIITVVLLSLLAFILFGLPVNIVYYYIYYFHYIVSDYSIYSAFLCASINSTVNPFIYFLVGKEKKGKSKESLKVIIRKVFEEENEKKNVAGNFTL